MLASAVTPHHLCPAPPGQFGSLSRSRNPRVSPSVSPVNYGSFSGASFNVPSLDLDWCQTQAPSQDVGSLKIAFKGDSWPRPWPCLLPLSDILGLFSVILAGVVQPCPLGPASSVSQHYSLRTQTSCALFCLGAFTYFLLSSNTFHLCSLIQ